MIRFLAVLFLSACSDPQVEGRTQPVVSTGMVISQIYGAGGLGGANYKKDYVELFNRGTSAVNIGNWSVQYGSDNGNLTQKVDIPAGKTVQPGHYFLVTLGSSGSPGAVVPSPDVVGSAINMGRADGKVGLVNTTTALGCGGATRCNSPNLIDLVGYGQATDFEGTASVSPVGSTGAIFRAGGGCIETDNNSNDFVGGTASPRNSGTPAHDCESDAGLPDLAPLPDLTPPPDLNGVDFSGTQPATGGRVVISQFYGSGGETGASFTSDFVELFNRSNVEVDLSDWSLQYGSKDNNFSLKVAIPEGTVIPAGGYFLIRLSQGGNTGASVADPDLTVNMPAVVDISASNGKLALLDVNVLAGCGSTHCTDPAIVDLVGYGASSDFEDVPASPFATAAQALFRKDSGCQDTNHNFNDFQSAAAAPRNSTTAIHLCGLPVAMPDLSPAADLTPIDLSPTSDDSATPDDGATPSDGPRPTDGGAPVDAARAPDLSIEGVELDASVPVMERPRASTGCSCDLTGSSTSTSGLWLLAIGFLLRRRRYTPPAGGGGTTR